MRTCDGTARITAPTSAVLCRQSCNSASHRGGLERAVSRGHIEEDRGVSEGHSQRLKAVGRGGYVRDDERLCVSHLPSARGGKTDKKQAMQLSRNVNKAREINTQQQGVILH